MSMIDEIEFLLDSRGAEWREYDGKYVYWADGDHEFAATQSSEYLLVVGLTPSLAVEATIGRGECRNDSLKRDAGVFVCSECGAYLDISDMSEEDIDVFYEPKYCPDCGAKVMHND